MSSHNWFRCALACFFLSESSMSSWDLHIHLREGKLSGVRQRHYYQKVQKAIQSQPTPVLMPMEGVPILMVPIPMVPIPHRDHLLLCPRLRVIHHHTYG